MKFSAAETARFGTSNGAFSDVKSSEHGDSQITLTDFEKDVVKGFFGDTIHEGNVRSNPEAAAQKFRLHASRARIELNLVYQPKTGKPSELRLYLQDGVYKPKAGSNWFVYVLGKTIYLGSMTQDEWRGSSPATADMDDTLYQNLINGSPDAIKKVKAVGEKWKRDPKIAKSRLAKAHYRCEVDAKHQLFKSAASGKRYVEAHHLVPMGLQGSFKETLDHLDNIYCLCPHCHALVHHAPTRAVKRSIRVLLKKRSEVLKRLDISENDVLRCYGCS